ncbi:sugar kinase [Flavihumibacter profundi]|uniref:sugar kinase n=1 Tax=Flavihumibacter profundi TaxID=2716883 RepID=UPI001CC65A27|nr:sugar kinase [Flavihumibacter profundi]MBZ5856670.1 sugar kinase [Flavihumibacter profundi]
MRKVFCFGELLLRLSPAPNGEWLRKHVVPVYAGGAELNVATALSRWGMPVRYFTALPDHYLSHDISDYLLQQGIDTSAIRYSGERIGTYYLPPGTDLKNSGVIYDRANSSFASLMPGQIEWEILFDGVEWFHFSAICPALNENLAKICEEALLVATKKGIRISVDLNYRAKLWQYGKKPVEIMDRLLPHCQLIMGNIWSANSLAGIPVDENIHPGATRDTYLDHAAKTALAIKEKYSACNSVALTYRFEKGNGIDYFGTLHLAGGNYCSPLFTTKQILDRVGSGDCFMGGLIYGIYNEHLPQHIISFAAAAAFGKLLEYGDATQQSASEVESLLKAYE